MNDFSFVRSEEYLERSRSAHFYNGYPVLQAVKLSICHCCRWSFWKKNCLEILHDNSDFLALRSCRCSPGSQYWSPAWGAWSCLFGVRLLIQLHNVTPTEKHTAKLKRFLFMFDLTQIQRSFYLLGGDLRFGFLWQDQRTMS